MKIYIYLTNGNVFNYEVESQTKAREHAEKIMVSGFRGKIGKRMEWFTPKWIDKIAWDLPEQGDYLSEKYDEKVSKC